MKKQFNKITIPSLLLATTIIQGATFNVTTTPELRIALETSATNGEDDTIILADGTYKTTDDGKGTFIYLSNEDKNLTIQGSSADNVVLSGDNQNQILNHNSTKDAPMKLEKLTFVDGNNTEEYGNGGAVYTDYSIDVVDCSFSNNSASYGGGFRSSNATVTNSTFSNNSANNDGGGFYSSYGSTTTVTNSTFTNNSASSMGGGFKSYDEAIVTNSTFINNSANYDGGGFDSSGTTVTNSSFTNNSSTNYGGGFDSDSYATVTNSTFINNNATYGGGFLSFSDSTVTNSTFTNNSANNDGGGFYSYYYDGYATVTNSSFTGNNAIDGAGIYSSQINASNLLIKGNSNGIYVSSGESNIIINSIFIDNNSSDINGTTGVIISNLENNYINLSKVFVSSFKSNNIFDGVNLGFSDGENGDYTLTSSSDLIDVGTTDVSIKVKVCKTEDEYDGEYVDEFNLCQPYGSKYVNLNFTELPDIAGNQRVSGSSIDIGVYEFSSTKPTITNISYTGETKAYSTLTFNTTSTPSDTRTIVSTEYDFNGDGSYTTSNSYSYPEGTYTVKVKVTDSEGEYSISSKEITIAPLPFEEMSLEQKLASLTTDQTKINSIIADINDGETVSTALSSDDITNLPIGWTLVGTKAPISDLSIFSSANIVWTYNNSNSSWSAYSPDSNINSLIQKSNISTITQIPANSGIWVLIK